MPEPRILTDAEVDMIEADESWETGDLIHSLRAARLENERLRAANRNIRGDNQCWLEEGGISKVPPAPEFLESCRRYHAQVARVAGELGPGHMTIAQLEARVEELTTERDGLRLMVGGYLDRSDAHLARANDSLDKAQDKCRELIEMLEPKP